MMVREILFIVFIVGTVALAGITIFFFVKSILERKRYEHGELPDIDSLNEDEEGASLPDVSPEDLIPDAFDTSSPVPLLSSEEASFLSSPEK